MPYEEGPSMGALPFIPRRTFQHSVFHVQSRKQHQHPPCLLTDQASAHTAWHAQAAAARRSHATANAQHARRASRHPRRRLASISRLFGRRRQVSPVRLRSSVESRTLRRCWGSAASQCRGTTPPTDTLMTRRKILSSRSEARMRRGCGMREGSTISPSVTTDRCAEREVDVTDEQLVYHGLTSLSQGATLTDDLSPLDSESASNPLSDPSFAPFFQVLATSKHVSVAPAIGDALLECFFCYSSPLYNVVQRSIFLRERQSVTVLRSNPPRGYGVGWRVLLRLFTHEPLR